MLYAMYADTMDMRLGERIRQLREERDLSLRELARQLEGGSAAHLSDIELGRRLPSEELLRQIAMKLGVAYAELEELDARPPVEALRRRSEQDPVFGFALRRMVEQNVKPDELLKFLQEHKDSEAKKKEK
jgi:transcriptional regulator with XRE-family HTH domain